MDFNQAKILIANLLRLRDTKYSSYHPIKHFEANEVAALWVLVNGGEVKDV